MVWHAFSATDPNKLEIKDPKVVSQLESLELLLSQGRGLMQSNDNAQNKFVFRHVSDQSDFSLHPKGKG